MGVWGLGVRVRMRGVCTTTNPLSRFFILWLGVAPNFSVFFCEFRSAACLARRVKKWSFVRKNASHSDPNP